MQILIINLQKDLILRIPLFKHAKYWQDNGHNIHILTVGDGVDGFSKVETAGNSLFLRLKLVLLFLSPFSPDYDLVVESWVTPPFYTPFLSKTKRLIFINEAPQAKPRGSTPPKERSYLIPELKLGDLAKKCNKILNRFYWNTFKYKRTYKKSFFLTYDEVTKNRLIQTGVIKSNIKIIRNGVELTMDKKAAKGRYLTAVGIENEERAYQAIKIFELIERRSVDWKYQLITQSVSKSKVKALMASSPIKKKTEIYGLDKVKKALNGSYLVIAIGRIENMNVTVAGIMSRSIPFVVYKGLPAAKLVKHKESGLIIESDPSAAASTALQLINDKKEYNKLAVNGKKHAKSFSWEEVVKTSLAYIESI